MLFLALASLVGLASLVCWILVEIKIFQDGKTVAGIVGIVTCGIGALIYGWMNVDRYNIRTLMTVWSVLVGINLVLRFAAPTATTTTYTAPNGTNTTVTR